MSTLGSRYGPSLVTTLVLALATVALYGAWLTDHGVFTHEASDPYSRTAQLLVEVRDGNIPPQLLPDARAGGGSAFPRYYPPLPFGVATAIAAVSGGDAVLGVNLAFVVAALASAISMSFVVSRLTGDRRLATGAALIYLAAPYHLLDTHVRGALGESFAFVWIPLILYGTWRAVERARVEPILAISIAGLLLTHTISALLTGFGIAAIAAVAPIRGQWRTLARIGTAGLLGFGIAAWFLVPQQLELGDVWASNAEHMVATDAAVEGERVAPSDLLGSWRNGFRGYDEPPFVESQAGPCWLFFCGADNFAVGPVALALPMVAGSLFAINRRRDDRRRPSALGAALTVSLALWLVFAIQPGVLLAWLPAQFGYVQFPWRALAPATAAIAILWALVLRGRRHGGTALIAIGIAAVALIPSVQLRPWDRPDVTDACFTRADVQAPSDPLGDDCFVSPAGPMPQATGDRTARDARSARGFTTANDYLPTSVDPDDALTKMIREPVVIDGAADIVEWHRTDDGLVATIVASKPSTVRLPATAYTFTRVSSDRGRVERADVAGNVTARVQEGTTTLRVSRTRTAAEWLGLALTLLSVAALVLIPRRSREIRAARAKVSS